MGQRQGPLLSDAVCLITGASGIAATTAVAAAREGASVFVASLHEAECRAVADAVRGDGGRCEYAAVDLTDEAAVDGAVDQCRRRFGRIDALFNVAGISGRRFGDGPVHECTLDGWRTTLDVNLKALFLASRAVLRVMMAQPSRPDSSNGGSRGSVLNMASVLAFSPRADYFATHAYAASKGAIVALTGSMAAYYAPHKIRVNAIAPGLVRTPMSRRAQEDPVINRLLKTKQPLADGFIEAADVAESALFLLSDRARSVTGITYTIDAGWCVSE